MTKTLSRSLVQQQSLTDETDSISQFNQTEKKSYIEFMLSI